MANFDEYLMKAECPCCKARGTLKRHDTYKRTIIDFYPSEENHQRRTRVDIPRVVCTNCKTCGTNAVLPDVIIPYLQFSLPFILRVMSSMLLLNMSIDKTAAYYSLDINTIKKWKRLFEQHRQEWLGILQSLETSTDSFMQYLYDLDIYSSFAAEFVLRTMHSFMQSHANPAHCYQRPFP